MQPLLGVQGCVPSTPPDWQSRVRPCEFVVVQASVARGPRSQKPVAGLAGVPLTGGPVPPALALHTGQGWAALPVRTTKDDSGTCVVDAPEVRSSVPVAGEAQVFITQVDRTPVAIGSGVGR